MLRHRPPRSQAPSAPPGQSDWPAVAQGRIHWVRQSCLVFGRDRHTPTESRPALTITQRDSAWVVLPGTTKGHPNDPEFFFIASDSRDCMIDKHKSPRDQYFCRRYECINLSSCEAHLYGILTPQLRIAVMAWLRERLAAGAGGKA